MEKPLRLLPLKKNSIKNGKNRGLQQSQRVNTSNTRKILVFKRINGRFCISLRKTTFRDAPNGFPANWRMTNEPRNSVLMTCHHPDLGSASNWLKHIWPAIRPIDLIHDTRHLCTRSRIDGIKAMSCDISGGKQVIKFANTSNRGRVY